MDDTMTGQRPHVAGLTVFPMKSAHGTPLLSARIAEKGLVDDRSMMVVDESGKAITARAEPALLRVRVVLDGDEIVLLAPDRPPLTLHRSAMSALPDPVSVWSSQVSAKDGGDAAASWLSAHLGRPCRLALQDDRRLRAVRIGGGGIVSLADTAPLLLASTASLDELNLYLEEPAEMERFRPNLVVTGAPAFDEDGWGMVRIGEVEFEVAGPCDRCVMVTLDPETGAQRRDQEPLALLGRQRRGDDGKVYFGQFLIPRTTGRVNLGDPVEVVSRKQALVVAPGTANKVRRLAMPGTGPSSSKREKVLTCVGITDETPDIRTFRFRADAPFSYAPGQFITLMPVIDGAAVRRNYTISSSPSRPSHLSVTVKRAEDGHVSRWLHDNLRVGDRLDALGPNGRFHLQAAGESRRLLLLSAGSGITPMMSILRYLADAEDDADIVFHHSARGAADMAFAQELRLIAAQLGKRLRISWNLTGHSDDSAIDAPGEVHSGRLDSAMMRAVCPDLAERTVFCCGPTGFRNAARAIHEGWRPAPQGPFLEESFGADPDAEDLPPIGDYSVTFLRSGKVVRGEGATTLLAAARSAGIDVPADCEAGICGTCRCKVAAGDWRVAANAADRDRMVLTEAEKASGIVLACSTSPIGDVQVDL